MSSCSWRPKVGDRVRIRVRGDRHCEEVPHLPNEDGRTGRVLRDQPLASAPSHPYLVMLNAAPADEHPERRTAAARLARHYAADELVLLE